MNFLKFASALLIFTTYMSSATAGSIEYVVDLSDVRNHYVTVTVTIEPTGKSTELMLPVWTPGSYLIREYARHIDSFSAIDENGNALVFEKSRKNRWKVATENSKRLTVSYRVYCNELSVRTNFVDNQFALLNGAPTFITVAENRDSEHRVQLILPKKWKRSATSLKSGDVSHHYIASSFDELVDSPIVAGNINVYPFEVAGIRHELVNVGESGYWDGDQAASDLSKVVAAHHELWGVVPYSRYLFINVICGRGGGLEHDNSTVMLTSRWSFRDKNRYKSWLSLASHEFFHTWNVRRLRPKALVNYDYENEVYTPSLWIAEGITSYYEDLLLVRAGLIDSDKFLDWLSKKISSVQNRPGRLVQSLKDSSYDSWIKFYRPSDNSRNTQISYYSKGAVVGFLLDAEIRKVTEGAKSLDDVMKKMYRDYWVSGYESADFRKVVADVCGKDLSRFFEQYVDSTAELDFENAKVYFGLRLPADDEEEAAENEEEDLEDGNPDESEDNVESEQSDKKGWLGFSLSGNNIDDVELDSPANRAGLNDGDELIAIDGIRIRGDLDRRLGQFDVGDEVELLVSRREVLSKIRLTIIPKPEKPKWNLKRLAKPSEEQESNLSLWLSLSDDDGDGKN